MLKLGITGGLACGKSTACHFFKEFGAFVVSADQIVHQLLKPNTPLGQKVIALLGSGIVNEGQIDRQVISTRVFDSPELLAQLEQLIHPVVRTEIKRLEQQAADAPLMVVEIPLLFEAKMEGDFDSVLAIVASDDLCRERFTDPSFSQRMARQLPLEEKARRATYTIRNNGTPDELRGACWQLFQQLTCKDSR